VSILGLQLLRDRIPTKYNLFNRDIISSEAALCTTACGQAKMASHFSCIAPLLVLCGSWSGLG